MLETIVAIGLIGAIYVWIKARSIKRYQNNYDKMHDYWMKHYD